MNDRSRAIAVLQQARQILQDRLTQRVLEMAEEILDDAAGDSYAGEIDSLHEQLGMRLTCVNALLSGLPPTEALHPHAPTAQVSTLDFGGLGRLEGVPGYPAVDTATSTANSERADQGPVTFQTFLRQI